MSKKIVLLFIVGILLLTACKAETEPPTPTKTATEPTAVITEAATEDAQATPTEFATERMPCLTALDYETNPETDQYQAVADQLPPLTEEDWMRGDPEAPITIVEYADFQCPACGNFAMYLEALRAEFPDSIRIVFRHMPLESIHDKAYIASMAAEAAGAQGKFWEMYDVLYQRQQEWAGYDEEDFVNWAIFQAELLDLDVEQFKADLKNEALRTELETVTAERLALGLHYTPFVVVNDRIFRQNNPDLFGLIGMYEFGGYSECPPWVIEPDGSYAARIETTAGEIVVDLYAQDAPLAVNSFIFLAENGWFDDVYFHRVMADFVAQAGDPSGLGVIGPGYSFINETDNDLSFDKAGVLGMANAGPDTNGSQFFITLAPTTDLDGGYTIFGQVRKESLAVLDEIAVRDPQTATDFANATQILSIEIIEN